MSSAKRLLLQHPINRNNVRLLYFLSLLLLPNLLFAQGGEDRPTFYLGFSYGLSFPVGDFGDTDIDNPDAGFAKNGNKIDLFVGVPIDDKITIVGLFRYQSFETDIDDLVNDFRSQNPGVDFNGSTEDWQTYSLLAGLSYQIKLAKNFSVSPRFGLGPMFVRNPGFTVTDITGASVESVNRSSETGFGLGYEVGFGLRKDLGKHFSLMPAFTLSGGFITIYDVSTTIDNSQIIGDYSPSILSFNAGLSIAYLFY